MGPALPCFGAVTCMPALSRAPSVSRSLDRTLPSPRCSLSRSWRSGTAAKSRSVAASNRGSRMPLETVGAQVLLCLRGPRCARAPGLSNAFGGTPGAGSLRGSESTRWIALLTWPRMFVGGRSGWALPARFDRAVGHLVLSGCERAPQLPVEARVGASDWAETSRGPRAEVDADEYGWDAVCPAPRDSTNRSSPAAMRV